MDAIQALSNQLSDASEKLELANLAVAQLRADQKALQKEKARRWEEVGQLDEALAATAGQRENDATELAEQEAATARAAAQLHLRQLQLEAVPRAFNQLAEGFVDRSVGAASAAASMLADATKNNFWREQTAANMASIALLRQNHKEMLANTKQQKERELLHLKTQVEEEEHSLAMIEACLSVYEKKLLALPAPSVAPSVTPAHHHHEQQQQPPHFYAQQPQPQSQQMKRSHEQASQPHHPYPSLMPPQRQHQQSLPQQSQSQQQQQQQPQRQQRVTQHTHTVTRVTEEVQVEVEVVDAHPGHGVGLGLGLGLGLGGVPHQPYPQYQPQHHAQQPFQQFPLQQPDEADTAASDLPWYQQTKRRRSVQQTVSTTEPVVGLFVTPPVGSGADESSSSSSSSSSSRQGNVNAPHFKSGLDLLLQSEEGR